MTRAASHLSRALKTVTGRIQAGLLVALALAVPGCSKDETKGQVVGTVIVDGKPAEKGAIAFIPIDGMSATSGGMIEDGEYSASVPFGKAKVQIRVPKKVGQRRLYDTADSPVQPIMKEALPEKYNENTELQIDVQPGVNRQNFSLETE